MHNEFLQDLQWRGLIHQCTDLEALDKALSEGRVTLYCGFDPTAKSLHVGSLVPLVTLRRFMYAGHRALALVGGATGLIGDPSGKSAERVLQTSEDVAVQASRIRDQVSDFVDGQVVDNLDWTRNVTLLEFLRDVGKHFSVNAMIARDSVSSRLSREGDGISFTEFSYMLLQSHDFLKLAERENCTLQIGGSDQWGNMCSGVDLIRRTLNRSAMAMTLPLLTTSDGQKFGKTVKGAVWLDPEMTSPWEFYQFWLNVEDADVIKLLKLLTTLKRAEIEALELNVQQHPQARAAQRALARAMTAMVHGGNVANQLEQAAGVLFHKAAGIEELSLETLQMLAKSLPHLVLGDGDKPQLNELLVRTGLEESKTKANQVIKQSPAVSVNNRPQMDPYHTPRQEDWLHGRFLLLKKGKKSFALVERQA